MEAVNGVAEGPPPPSPLTGCYLLVVLGEPHTDPHKDIILQRLAKGLLSWNVNDCLVDLEKELSIVTEQGLEGEEARYGERLIQYASENLVTEILIHPSVSTLAQCVRNLLSSFTRHRHIIHAGYTFAANGSWILQDGTFSLADFSEAFQEVDVQRVIHAYENGISIDIHCSAEGEWAKLPKEPFTKGCKLRINPDDVLGSGLSAVTNFVNYIAPFLIPAELEHTLESSDVVGNIRFSRPTLYVFPGGQGDAALFGINGFNMLVDGGFSRKACFWDFVRHLDRLDAVILTRLNNSNANGIGAVLRRKAQNAVYPQIGHFFCNIQSRKANLSPDGDKDSDPLLINLLEEGHELISNLRSLDLSPQLCYRDTEPINLYHKVGHGTLDMYVLNPAKDSREVKEFLLRWNNNDQKLFANHKFSREYMLPLQNIVSICALLVWRPANPNDTITRILFPGSAPQGKIIEGLDRLKNLECIKHTVCTERTLVPSSKLKSKENILDKIVPQEKSKVEAKKNKIKPTPENKIIENNMKNGMQNGHSERQVTKAGSVESDKSDMKPPKPKKEEAKVADNKQEKVPAKPKADTNVSKTKQKVSDKKVSPPTPKKVIDTKKSEIDKDSNNQRARSKISPSATPAKSTKDANNRKVLESKTKSTTKKDLKETKAPEKKEEIKKVERKPISRRPKNEMKLPQSPVKRVVNGVHKPDSLGRKGKLDKEGTTDSSTVSTPSVDQDSLMKKDISKLTPEEVQQLKAQELAELKEEQEAIKELEAVFRKGDKINVEESGLREIKDTSIEDKTEPEEYLIVEKETIEPSPSETEIKEEETVKLARDSEESEKKKDRDERSDDKDKQVDTEQEESGIGEQETDIEDGDDIRDNAMSKEPSVLSPEENKRFISKEDELKESQPEEKISANIESGATTTAPTLPEDERIPLNEIKEDQIEEKHVREETKEKETKEVPVITLTSKPVDNLGKVPTVVGIRLDKESRIRDIVKTPDEVADLPVHEEVDVDHLVEYVHEGTEKTKLKDITQEVDLFVKDDTSKEDEKIDKQKREGEQQDMKLEKTSVHVVEIESPEKKRETVKDDFESKQTPKESYKIVQELAEHAKPTAEIVADSAQEDQPLDGKAPEKKHELVDKETHDIKEMTIQPALDKEPISKDIKAVEEEKEVEVPSEIISSPSKKDEDVHEQKEVKIQGKENESSLIHSPISKGEVIESNDRGSEDLSKVEQDIISREPVGEKENRIHVGVLDNLAQTPKEKEVEEKLKLKEGKTSPISSVLEEEKKKLSQTTDEKVLEIHDEIESKIPSKKEIHTEQNGSAEKIEKVDREKIHEPLMEKHSPVASDIESSKLGKEEIGVDEKDKTVNIIDEAIKETSLPVVDEKMVETHMEKEKTFLGDEMASRVEDKKKHIQEISEEKQDSKPEAMQASPQKKEPIAKMIPDEDSEKIEPRQDAMEKEIQSVPTDKDDIDLKKQSTHDKELKAEISSEEQKVEQKLEMETADESSKRVELPKDTEVVMEHSEKKIESYEEQAAGSRRDSKTEVVSSEKLDKDLPTEEEETILLKTDSELASKIVGKDEETTDEKPPKMLAEALQEKIEEKQMKDESLSEKKHEEELLSAKLPTKQETDLLSTKEHTDKLDEKETDTSVINLKLEDSKIVSSEKKEKSPSPEPPVILKQEKEMKESNLEDEELVESVPTTHEIEIKRKDSLEISHEIIESRLEQEEKDDIVDKTRSPEKEKSPPKSPEQKDQKVHLPTLKDKTVIPLKDKLKLEKVSPEVSKDDYESKIRLERDETEEITKHDEKRKSSISEPSAKQIPEQSALEIEKEEGTSGITKHEVSVKSLSPSLSQQKIEPSIKDEKSDTAEDDSKIKKEEKLDNREPLLEPSADQKIESTSDVKKITPTTEDSFQEIAETPVCIHETDESEQLVEQTISSDKSKRDDGENGGKSPLVSSEHSDKEDIKPVSVSTKIIPTDQISTKLEEEKSPSPSSNQFKGETISPKPLQEMKSTPVHDHDESSTSKAEVIPSKSDSEEQKDQGITESDEMKRSPSPSSEQSADQLSVESKIVSPISEKPNERESIPVMEALASKEDQEELEKEGIIELAKEHLSASPEQPIKLSSTEEKGETIPIGDKVEMKKTESREIGFEYEKGVDSRISPEHDKKSEKGTSQILDKDGDGSITPSTDKSVKEEKHSTETTLEVLDSKIKPIQKESAELLATDIKNESVSTLHSKVEKRAPEKDDLVVVDSKEEEKVQDHIEPLDVEKSSLITPESTSRKQSEEDLTETKVDKELIHAATILETKDASEKIQDSEDGLEYEKEKPSSLSSEILKEDTSGQHSTIDGKTQPLSSVLHIEHEKKQEVESSLPKKEEDNILTTRDGLEKEDHPKMSPEIIESKEITKEEKFEKDSKPDEEEKLSSPTSERPSKEGEELTISKNLSEVEEKAVIKDGTTLQHSKPSSSPTEMIEKQAKVQDMKSETEKDSTQPTEDLLDKMNKDIISSSESKLHQGDRSDQEQSIPDVKEKSQILTEPMESKDLDDKIEEIAKTISPKTATQDITLVESGDERSVYLPHENIKDVSDEKIDGESDTKTAEGESKEKVTEEPFSPFLIKRASLLEEAEVPSKYSEKEEKIDSKDINLNQEYHLPLKSEEIAQKTVEDETEKIHDSAIKPKEEVKEDIKVSSAETTELSRILGDLIRDADPDSVLEGSKKDDEDESKIFDGIKDQTPTEKLENEKESLSEAEKVHIEDQVEKTEKKDVQSRIVEEIQLDDIHNFLHQERSHTHREMESSVTNIKTDKKIEDVEKPVTEKPLDDLQAKPIEASIQPVQEFKEDKEEPVSSSIDSNKIDIEKDKENKSKPDHEKELLKERTETVQHIEDENKLEKGMMEDKEKDEGEEQDRTEVKCEPEEPLIKTEKIKIDLTDKPEHAEAVLLKSTPESPVINIIPSLPALPTDIDKMELGRKSPKEREEDVAKIVASVATVLKSDAPLEEFHGKIPLTTNTPYGAYTTELRETHITTCDSPVHDSSILHEGTHQGVTDQKIESSHSSEDKDDEKLDDHGLIKIDESEDPGTVHRMLVTASSEDGGEEIEICPPGTITFSKSSESSGRSSPENISRKPSQSSSALDTISDHTTVKELIESQPKKEEIEEHASKTSIEHLQSTDKSVEESKTPKLYPELDIKKGIESLEDQIECKVSSLKEKEEPMEKQQSSSDISKEISEDTKEKHETVSDKVHSIFGSILSSASKIEETISHAITDTIHSAESTIEEGLKKVESDIDEVKHKITKIESDAVESLSEKKEKAEQLISDRLKESASSLEKVFDETDKEKDSLIQGAQSTLNRISAPLKDTFGDLLSDIADSIKDKDDALVTAKGEKIEESREVNIDKEKEKPIPDGDRKETSAAKTEKLTTEPSSNLYPSLESEMKEEEKELDKLATTEITKDITKSDASTHEEKLPSASDYVKEKTDGIMKKEERGEKVRSEESEKTAPIILNGLDNEENVPDKSDKGRSADSGSTYISDDILSAIPAEIKSDVDEGTETPQKKSITEKLVDAQEEKSNVEDSKISSSIDTSNERSSSPQKSLEAHQIPPTSQHDIDSIFSSLDKVTDSAKDVQKQTMKDLEEKKGTLVDSFKDLKEDIVKDLKEKEESSIHKAEDPVKEFEEKIVDLKEKEESVIDKTKVLMKDLKEEQDSVIHKTKESVKDFQELVVEDMKEKQQSVIDKTNDSVKNLKETVIKDVEEKQESLVHETSDSVKDLKEKVVDLKGKIVDDFQERRESLSLKTTELVENLEENIVDVNEKQDSVIDKAKDSIEDLKEKVVDDLKEKQESLVHKTADSLKDFEEKVIDLKEKQESVIEKTIDSVKDLEEKIVEDSKGIQESLIEKTEDSVKDLKEKVVHDLKEKQESLSEKTADSVKDLKEKIIDLKDKQESVIESTKDSVKDLKEKIVEDLKERRESFVDNTKAIETKVTDELKDLEHSIDSTVHESKEKFDSISTEVASVLQDSKNTLTDFSKDIKEATKLSKENLESSVTTTANEAEETTKSFLSDITSTIGKALPSFGFSQKEEESKHIENQKHSEEKLDKDEGTEKNVEVELSEKCDKTKQDTPSVITDISSIVKEEIESSFKDLIEVEKDATGAIAQQSSNIVDSLKSMKHTALEAGQTVKEDTGKALEEVKDKSVGLLIEGKEKVLQKTSDFESNIEGTKKAIHEKIEDISKNVKDVKDNLEDTVSSTKGTIESSLSEVAQDIEKEKEALKSVGKEIQSELKHAVDDVLNSGKQLFSGIFGKKKQDSVEEKPSITKKEEQHDVDSKQGLDDDHEQIQTSPDHQDAAKDTLSKLPKIETACEETMKEKYDTGVISEKRSTGSVPDSCDISKVDQKSCLEVSPSYEKKLSISDVEITVGEKLKDHSSDPTSTEHILRQDEVCTIKPFDALHKPQLRDDTAIVGDLNDEIIGTKATGSKATDSSTVDKHITDLPASESSSKGDVPVQKSPTQIHCEKTMDSDDDSLGSARSMSSQVPLCKNMDPMSMSFYGALPDEADFLDNDEVAGEDYESSVSFVHLHDITKAKVDGKLVESSTNELEKPQSTDKFPVQDPMTSSFYGELPSGKDEKDPIESWGKPLGLPSPAPPNERGTPKKERRLPSNVMAKNRINDDFARSESPSKNKKKINPVYVDLTYVPHHGNSNYSYVDFFKKVRARYYVFSGIEPSREVYNALLEAKQTWEDKDLEVTIIPTYDTDVLGYWVAENEELLAKYKIDLSPSASRCTINLQDHETSCSAYRLEF